MGDPVPENVRQAIENDRSVIRTGFVSDVAPYYHLMDVMRVANLPGRVSGMVSLEAQAAGIPVVTTQATGAVDSVLDQQTGFIVPVGDTHGLSAAISRLLDNPSLRKSMGEAGRKWVETVFPREIIWKAHAEAYERLIAGERLQ